MTDNATRYLNRGAWGHGLATVTTPDPNDDTDPVMLDVWYPHPVLGDETAAHAPVGFEAPTVLRHAVQCDPVRGVETEVIFTTSNLAEPPLDIADVYLRLHLLSNRLVRPGEVNLEGMEKLLPLVVWTDVGPCVPEGFEHTAYRIRMDQGHTVTVNGISQIPRMLDYVVPADIEVIDADAVRLGAHLAPGTAVRYGGQLEANSGTESGAIVTEHIPAGTIFSGPLTAGAATGSGILHDDGGSVQVASNLHDDGAAHAAG
ncbi:MAG: 2,3,4,5-tetrahydropyridine-2,6-dicarboxylate N-succinyltransferase [Promicromonosporaceae bacterium]|nr:2,3,4,5-tetrahydropyridine-2,6-dicarboxylate N-succinyltransferase [Promicromonosporaceae bacterium]